MELRPESSKKVGRYPDMHHIGVEHHPASDESKVPQQRWVQSNSVQSSNRQAPRIIIRLNESKSGLSNKAVQTLVSHEHSTGRELHIIIQSQTSMGQLSMTLTQSLTRTHDECLAAVKHDEIDTWSGLSTV